MWRVADGKSPMVVVSPVAVLVGSIFTMLLGKKDSGNPGRYTSTDVSGLRKLTQKGV